MINWSTDLRSGDVLERGPSNGARERALVCDTRRHDGWNLRSIGAAGAWGRPVFFTHNEVEEDWQPPELDTPAASRGRRALLTLTLTYDDGRVIKQVWVEGGPCELDSFAGVVFEFRGFVDERAASLPQEELWVHQDDLLDRSYRFIGDSPDPTVLSRASNPPIGDEPRRSRRRRRTGRR